MATVIQIADRPTARRWSSFASRMISLSLILFLGTAYLHSQCPNNDQTKVFNSKSGSGFYLYRFLGDRSFRYFIDGKKFSFNDKDHLFRAFVFVDDIAYESTFVGKTDLSKYVKSSMEIDILRAQAKHMQDDFKAIVPSMVVTDYGPSARQNPDGSDDRLFYLWKKENVAGDHSTTQFLCSTVVKDSVVVLSIMPMKESVTEDDLWKQIEKYTSRFDTLSVDQCAQALAMPSTH